MTIRIQVTKGLKWQVIKIAGRQGLSLIVFTILARLLAPSAFGLVSLVGVYIGFVGMFADQGIGMSIIQRAKIEPEHLDSAFWFNLAGATLICIATVGFAGPISRIYHEPRLAPLLRWSSISLIFSALSAIHSTLFMKAMDFRRPTLRLLIANATGGAVGIAMAFAGFGVWSLVGQQLIAALAGTVFLWSVSPYRPTFRFSPRHLRELFGVSSSVFASVLLWFLTCKLDQIVIGRFSGVGALGVYVIGGKVPDYAKLVTHDPVAEVSLPALSKLQDDHHRLRQAIYRGMELNAILSFAIFVGLSAVATDAIPLFFGSKWASAAGVCSLLSLYALVIELQVFFYPALLASGGPGRYVILNALQMVGVFFACSIGIHWGVATLIWGLIANGVLIAIPALIVLRNRIGLSIREYCKPCLIPGLASAFMLATIVLTAKLLPGQTPLFLRLASKIFIGALAYLGFIAMFARRALSRFATVFRHLLPYSGWLERRYPIIQESNAP